MTTRLWVKSTEHTPSVELIKEIAKLPISWEEKTKLATKQGIVNKYGQPYTRTGFKTAARNVLADDKVEFTIPPHPAKKDISEITDPYDKSLEEVKEVLRMRLDSRKKLMILKTLVNQ